MIRIRPERPADFPDIDELVRESFLKGTPYSDGQAEVALIHEIREKGYYLPEGAFVAERDGEMAGHFMLSRLPLSEDAAGNFDPGRVREDILLLAPVAVKFACLYQGIGTEMLSQGVKWAKDRGFRAIVVEGNPDYYHRFGFQSAYDYGILPTDAVQLPRPECLMIQPLYPGALEGIKGFIGYGMYEAV